MCVKTLPGVGRDDGCPFVVYSSPPPPPHRLNPWVAVTVLVASHLVHTFIALKERIGEINKNGDQFKGHSSVSQ